MNYNIQNVTFSFNTKGNRRILSTKTKFFNSNLYRCENLTAWLRYKECMFRWQEVLFFLDIPPFEKLDLVLFAEKVQENWNGNFYELLKLIEVYFNQEDVKLNFERRLNFQNGDRK